MEETIISIDFKDLQTANIYGQRLFHTARILGLDFKYRSDEFGDGKCHYNFIVGGPAKDLEMFLDFVEKAVKLEPDIKYYDM